MLGKANIGILGTGNIAATMAATIEKMKGVRLYAVASREKVKADVFAGRYGIKKAYGSYEELVKDKKVDLVYVATPHSEHFANARLCIEYGKPVLCEKAFTANASQAEELIRLATEKGVFITEAMWTRYMPMLTTIREVIGSGVIGDPKALTANLGYVINHLNRLTDPALAGGALLDVGVYPLNFALMIFGNNIEKVVSTCTYTDTGVDEQNSIILQYYDGRVAYLNSSINSLSDRKGTVYGTRGYIVVENISNFESVSVYDSSYKKVGIYRCPKKISGYEYEVEASLRAIRAHQLECEEMPHSETIRVMKLLDSLRKEWGIIYPFEDPGVLAISETSHKEPVRNEEDEITVEESALEVTGPVEAGAAPEPEIESEEDTEQEA